MISNGIYIIQLLHFVALSQSQVEYHMKEGAKKRHRKELCGEPNVPPDPSENSNYLPDVHVKLVFV